MLFQMARFLHQRVTQSKWMEEYHDDMYYGAANLGAFVRRHDGEYASTTRDPRVTRAVKALGASVAFTMSCDVVSVFMEQVDPKKTEMQFMDGYVLPVVASVDTLAVNPASARAGHLSCLCRKEHFVLVWAASPPQLLAEASSLESHIVGMVSSTLPDQLQL